MRAFLFFLILPFCANSQTFLAGENVGVTSYQYGVPWLGMWADSCHALSVLSGNNPNYWDLIQNASGGCDVIFVPSGFNLGVAGNVVRYGITFCFVGSSFFNGICTLDPVIALPADKRAAVQASGSGGGFLPRVGSSSPSFSPPVSVGFDTASQAEAAGVLGVRLANDLNAAFGFPALTAGASAAGLCGNTSIQCYRAAFAAASGLIVSQLGDISQLVIFCLTVLLVLFAFRSGLRRGYSCA